MEGCNYLTRYVWVCAKRKRERRQEESRNKDLVDERKRKSEGTLAENVRPPANMEQKKREMCVKEKKGKRGNEMH